MVLRFFNSHTLTVIGKVNCSNSHRQTLAAALLGFHQTVWPSIPVLPTLTDSSLGWDEGGLSQDATRDPLNGNGKE